MTLNEAIKHCEEVVEDKEIDIENQDPLFPNNIEECKRCAEEHRQLAEWLKELKQLREQTYLNKRIEYGTDGNLYEMSISNGKEYEERNTDAINVQPIPDQETQNNILIKKTLGYTLSD